VNIIEGVDLADESQTERFYDELVDEYGSLWGSVNAAGGFGMGALLETSFEEFSHQVSINLYTCYNSCRAAARAIQNNASGGRMVNVASRPALEPRKGSGLSAYTSSKAAVVALTEALAAELVDEEILVNAVAPSIIDTASNRKAMPNADHSQWVSPETIGSHILYLMSPVNRTTQGAIVPIYGNS
jgi:NAD(P)-dependent dehydrogenase (short-subunit alcohol dehydrogenase family)